MVDSVAAPIAGSKGPRDVREFRRGVAQVGMTATDKTIGNQRQFCKFLENNYKHVIKNKTERLSHIIFFKNILYTRIKKCIDFLRLYNINTNQLVYRL